MNKRRIEKPRLDPLVMDNLVRASMFYHWVTCHEQEEAKSGDRSWRQAIDAAREELGRHGWPIPTIEEFTKQLEETLTLDSHEFVRRLETVKAIEAEIRARLK